MAKRVFLIVLDSFGIGEMPDAADFGDAGSDTLGSIFKSAEYDTPVMQSMGLFNIDGVRCGVLCNSPDASFARLRELSKGKDTTIGHWEIAGVVSPKPLPTYPHGFPQSIIDEVKRLTGRDVLCNKPYSGTELLKDYGEEHLKTGALLVYTSADSVFQVAAHEDIVPVPELYRYCQLARDMLTGEHAVGRVIARPFVGTDKTNFKRTPNRHDFSLKPPADTMLDCLSAAGLATIGVGKIYDIFAGVGVSEQIKSKSNADGMRITSELAGRDFSGLAFVNLVDFDMLYGHRNDIDGYARAATEFDRWLAGFKKQLRDDDVLIITADHGCDPGTPSTDHSRECVPMLAWGAPVRAGVDLKTRDGFCDIAASVCDYLGVSADISGRSFWGEIAR